MNLNLENLDLFSFLATTTIVIIWWRAVWTLLDTVFHFLAKGKKAALIAFDLASIGLILVVLFNYPTLRESF